MKSGAATRSIDDLAQENAELRAEVRVARRASDITAHLVAEQFSRIEEILLRLEEKAQVEQQLGRDLADQLREAETRERELAREREQLKKMQVAAVNMMEDISAARSAAEAATRSKSEFLANMSHEIRTPMTAITGFASVVREELACCTQCPAYATCDVRTKSRENIETICRNGEHLLQIINDILDISKIEAGRLDVEHIRCSPFSLLADVQSLMQVRARAKNLPLTVEYVSAIPETIQSDPTRLKQILVNTIGNSIKFTEVGSVRLVTSFVEAGDAQHHGDGRPGEPQLQFDIVDTGLGMTEEQIAKLFRPFAQADTSITRKFGGTGLGLTISKRLAQMLGGDISVAASVPGVGTRLRVTVSTGPLDGVRMITDPKSATVVAADRVHRTSIPTAASLRGARVLLAEDGPDNQRLITHMLEKAGAKVTLVENGEFAVQAALAAPHDATEDNPRPPFDVILMDMQMPVMDGYTATGQLRRRGYTGPIIALTAHAMSNDRQKCLDAGCNDYASKPINRERLVETIRAYLRNGDAAENDEACTPVAEDAPNA